MKVRNGFVSNSSSSSFTCEACGKLYTGWDGQYNGDIRHFQCENGHDLCTRCVESKFSVERFRKEILEDIDDQEILDNPTTNSLEEWIDSEFGSLETYIMDKDLSWGLPQSTCPVCNFTTVSDDDLVRYLLALSGISRDEAICQIRKLGTITRLNTWIEGREKR